MNIFIISILMKSVFYIPSGDLKLFIIVILCLGFMDGIYIILGSLLLSLIILFMGIKKIPISVAVLLTYIPYFLKNIKI